MQLHDAKGKVTQSYTYDALNRLTKVTYNDGNVQRTIDQRYYDGADRVVQSGADGTLTEAEAARLKSGQPPIS